MKRFFKQWWIWGGFLLSMLLFCWNDFGNHTLISGFLVKIFAAMGMFHVLDNIHEIIQLKRDIRRLKREIYKNANNV